jgi:hypothetical protein
MIDARLSDLPVDLERLRKWAMWGPFEVSCPDLKRAVGILGQALKALDEREAALKLKRCA